MKPGTNIADMSWQKLINLICEGVKHASKWQLLITRMTVINYLYLRALMMMMNLFLDRETVHSSQTVLELHLSNTMDDHHHQDFDNSCDHLIPRSFAYVKCLCIILTKHWFNFQSRTKSETSAGLQATYQILKLFLKFICLYAIFSNILYKGFKIFTLW